MSLIKILTLMVYIGTNKATSEWEKYVASSTNDLSRLFEKENLMINQINHWVYLVESNQIPLTASIKEDLNLVQDTFNSLNLEEWRFDDPLEYCSHPINAYHLIKRTTNLWPNLYENTTSKALEDIFEAHIGK